MNTKMKLLTIAIPCFNSAEYMDRALSSALIGREELEIIIVDDGSTDETPEIAARYADEYPDKVRVIHKENGGHGDAVMAGLAAATGKYFKVLDSDDRLGETALNAVLDFLVENEATNTLYDTIISDYVYDKAGKKKKKRIGYRRALPVRTPFTWKDIGHFMPWSNILMHSVIYRTEALRKTGLKLPKHTFYVDNLYVYHPLPYMKRLYYLDVDLYFYFIGREDQSVNEKVMMKRIDQQIKVTRLMVRDHPLKDIEEPMLRKYMRQYLSMMMMICSAFLTKDGSESALRKKGMLWKELKYKFPDQYKEVNQTFLGKSAQMRTKAGQKIIKIGYGITQKVFGFN